MQYHVIPCIINNCWRSVPLPYGQYNGHFYCCSIQRQLYGCYSENIPFYRLDTITTTIATITMITFNNFSKVERVTMIIKVFAQVERVTRETEGNSLTALVTSPDGELQVLIMSQKMTNRIFICCNTPISFPLTLLSRVKR